ncbi:phage tail tape measure protein [Sulfurospirillum sp. 1612]|uniref:phage tail tape measure protein n=1 Tax=Sulfurospirillum sp. 1612 TaxID=3094835 RepID=UPI002F95FDF6
MSTTIGTVLIDIKADTAKLISGMDKAESSVTKSVKQMKQTILSLVSAYAGFEGINKVTNSFISLENAQIAVKKTTGLSGQSFKALDSELKKMSTTMAGLNLDSLYSISEAAGQLGIRGVDNIANFSKVISMIGLTTDLSAQEAGTAFAKLSNQMGEPISNISKLASVFNELSNRTTATVRDLLMFSSQIVGAGKTVGLTTADIAGISAALTDLGINYEVGGSAISKTLMLMSANTNNFAKQMGVNAQEFANDMRDKPIKALNEFFDVMSKLSSSDKINFLSNLGLGEIRTSGVLLKLSSSTKTLSEDLKISNDEYTRGTSIQNEYVAASQGLQAQNTKLSSSLKILAASYGEDLKSPIMEVSSVLVELSKYLTDNKSVIKSLGGQITLMASSVVGAKIALRSFSSIVALATNAATIYGGAYGGVNRAIVLTTVSTKALSLAMKSLPFIGIAATIYGIGDAFLSSAHHADELNEAAQRSMDSLKKLTKHQLEYQKVLLNEAEMNAIKDFNIAYIAASKKNGSDDEQKRNLAILDDKKIALEKIRNIQKEINGLLAPSVQTLAPKTTFDAQSYLGLKDITPTIKKINYTLGASQSDWEDYYKGIGDARTAWLVSLTRTKAYSTADALGLKGKDFTNYITRFKDAYSKTFKPTTRTKSAQEEWLKGLKQISPSLKEQNNIQNSINKTLRDRTLIGKEYSESETKSLITANDYLNALDKQKADKENIIRLKNEEQKIEDKIKQAVKDKTDHDIFDTALLNNRSAQAQARLTKEKDINSVLQARYDKERANLVLTGSTFEGMKDAYDTYAKNIPTDFQTGTKLMVDGLQGVEDAFVNFVKTGKLSFKDLADSMIADLVRIQIKKALVGASSGMSGVFGSIGTGIMSLFGANGGMIPAKAYATGGLLTGGSGVRDDLYLGSASGSNIFAMGGEYILNKQATNAIGVSNLNHMNNTGTVPSGNVIINVENKSGTPIDMKQVSQVINQNGDKTIQIVMNAIERNPDMRNAIKGVR